MNVAEWITERATELTKRQVERHTSGLKHKVASYGIGAGLGAAAVVFALLGILFGLATCAAALATVMSVWASLLIVTGALFLIAGITGLLAAAKLRHAKTDA